MIQSLPGPGSTPPRPDPPVEPRKAPRDSGFAGLLGAGDRPVVREGAEVPVAEPSGSPFEPLVADGLDPEAAKEASSAAERFNEHGFFGDAVASPAAGNVAAPPRDGARAADAIVAGEAPLETFVPGGSSALILSDQHASARLAEKSLQSVLSGRAGAAARTALQRVSASPASAPSVTSENGATSDSVRKAATPGRRLIEAAANRAAQSAARVAISETELGLRVAALAGTLSADERNRLRDEIAALLSRHGLVPGHIHIAARPAPRALAQENIR